jgi:hypothetical protein
MHPIMILGFLGLGGIAIYEYLKSKAAASTPQPPPAYASPQLGWTYQGPIPPTVAPTADSATVNITLTPGAVSQAFPAGSNVTWNLPAGATWYPNVSPPDVGTPTSLGGTVDSSATSYSLNGINGAGTISFNWTDSSGTQQQALFTATTPSGVPTSVPPSGVTAGFHTGGPYTMPAIHLPRRR